MKYVLRGMFFVLTLLPLSGWALTLNGVAVHKELGKELFVSGLYVESETKNANKLLTENQNSRMELRFLSKKFSARRLMRLWVEGITVNTSPGEMSAERANLVKFSGLVKGRLKHGDHLIFDYQVNEGMSVKLDGVVLGNIKSGSFYRMLLSTWIGDVPLSSSFRKSILSAGEMDKAVQLQFVSLNPQAGRKTLVSGWVTPVNVAVAKKPKLKVAAIAAKPLKTLPKVKKAKAKPKPKQKRAKAPKPAPVAESKIAKVAEEEEEDMPLVLDEATLKLRQQYYASLVAAVVKYQSLPPQAFMRRVDGSVRLSVVVDRKGKLISSEVIEQAHKMLGKQAMQALKKAQPLPPMPAALKGKQYAFSLPLTYRLPR